MKTKHKMLTGLALLALSTLPPQLSTLHAQTTAMTYQGRLSDGTGPASGIYDLRFTVYDAATNGNVVTGPITNAAVTVSNGMFCTLMDFGCGPICAQAIWLDLAVRTNGAAAFTPLTPRTLVTPVPLAYYANTASNLTGLVSTAQLIGTAGAATNFTGALGGDVTGTESATVVSKVNGVTAANVASAANAANAATSANTAGTIVKRDGSGNFSAGTITAVLSGNASSATTATGFSGSLSGDVTGSQNTTALSKIGSIPLSTAGLAANNVLRYNGTQWAPAADVISVGPGTGLSGGGSGSPTLSIANSGVTAGSYGAAGTVPTFTVNAQGQISTAANTAISIAGSQVASPVAAATTFTGSLSGDVSGTQSATTVATVGASTAVNVHAAEQLANAATNANTAGTIVKRDASGNFSAGTITASLSGNATSANSFSGSLSGDVTGSQNTTALSKIGSIPLSTAGLAANNVLRYNGTQWAPAADVISVGPGTGLSGGGSGSPTLSIANSGVTAGSYGAAGTVPAFTVNAQGQITAVAPVSIAIAGGQVTSPVGSAVSAATATNVVSGIAITNAFVTNSVFAGDGGGLTNLLATNLVGSGSLSNLTLTGNLYLPTTANNVGIIYFGTHQSGFSTLIQTYGSRNFFANAGNLTMGGSENVGIDNALGNNTSGSYNVAVGAMSLSYNSSGTYNTACGDHALQNAGIVGASPSDNTAIGGLALSSDQNGGENTAIGCEAMMNSQGAFNTAVGFASLTGPLVGSNNIALGYKAGFSTAGTNNIVIGNQGSANDNNTIRIGTQGTQTNAYIAGIYGATSSGGAAVYVNSSGQLGTLTSSARFKTDIRDMAGASDALLALRPVTFRYKPGIDPQGIPQFGLVAEEVEKVNPDLVVHDDAGRPYTVRYEAVNAMLLNEFIKQHQQVEEQSKEIGDLKARLQRLEAAVNGGGQ